MILLLHALWQRTATRLARARQLTRERRAFNELPPYLLRDLGVDRSEYGSYLAESMADAQPAPNASQPTRRRLRGLG